MDGKGIGRFPSYYGLPSMREKVQWTFSKLREVFMEKRTVKKRIFLSNALMVIVTIVIF